MTKFKKLTLFSRAGAKSVAKNGGGSRWSDFCGGENNQTQELKNKLICGICEICG